MSQNINLNMPGGQYQYPAQNGDNRFMSELKQMTEQFNNAGAIVNGTAPAPAAPVQQASPAPQPAPVQQQAPIQQQVPAQQSAPVQQPAPQQELIENLPPAPEKKPTAKKVKAAPAPAAPVQKKPESVDDVKANFETDISNLKADFDDLVAILSDKPSVDPSELEGLKKTVEEQAARIQELEEANNKLKNALKAFTV